MREFRDETRKSLAQHDHRLNLLTEQMRDQSSRLAQLETHMAALLATAMARLRRRLGLDLSLDGYVKTDADRERLAEWAMKSGQVKMNPRAATPEDMRAILAAMRTPTGDAGPVLRMG